jgi:hypothetical protein
VAQGGVPGIGEPVGCASLQRSDASNGRALFWSVSGVDTLHESGLAGRVGRNLALHVGDCFMGDTPVRPEASLNETEADPNNV